MDQQQSAAKFEGWAVVELFGHQKEVGFVTTQYFGDKAMFQVDVPEMPERETALRSARYVTMQDGMSQWMDAGTKVMLAAVPGRSRLVSPGAVYAMNPCTEDVVRKMIDDAGRTVKIVDLPPEKKLGAGTEPSRVKCQDCGEGFDPQEGEFDDKGAFTCSDCNAD